jgi:hypothetical protein
MLKVNQIIYIYGNKHINEPIKYIVMSNFDLHYFGSTLIVY